MCLRAVNEGSALQEHLFYYQLISSLLAEGLYRCVIYYEINTLFYLMFSKGVLVPITDMSTSLVIAKK